LLKIKILVANVNKDHIHQYISIFSKYSISEIMSAFKGKTSIRMFYMF